MYSDENFSKAMDFVRPDWKEAMFSNVQKKYELGIPIVFKERQVR